ncbi:DUF397 domain-containing protein [Streptomyces sp. NPDC055092]
MPNLTWQKSSYSGGPEGNCVNIATAPDGTIRLRESDDPDTVVFTEPAQLALLIRQIKSRSGAQPR